MKTKKYVLTNYKQVWWGGKAADSDTKFGILETKCREKFKMQTSQKKDFSNCFQNNLPIIKQIENWQKVFQLCVRSLFRKVRIMRKKRLKPKISEVIDLQNGLTAEDDCNQDGYLA